MVRDCELCGMSFRTDNVERDICYECLWTNARKPGTPITPVPPKKHKCQVCGRAMIRAGGAWHCEHHDGVTQYEDEEPKPKPKKAEQPLYDEARSYFAEVQGGQIEKGREKYPADLNEDDWTALDLIDHAMQEAVDQIHYLTALRRKIRKL